MHLSLDDGESEHLVLNLEMLIHTRKSPNILKERKPPAYVVLWPTHAAAKQWIFLALLLNLTLLPVLTIELLFTLLKAF